MMQTPTVLFMYWQVSVRYEDIFRKTLGLDENTLRAVCVFQLKGEKRELCLELNNVGQQGSHYLEQLQEGCSYEATLGLYCAQKYIVIAQSDLVSIPGGASAAQIRVGGNTPAINEGIPEGYSFS